jgi:hypothetical protein
MAANFRTIVSRERETLHLKLEGDFDGSSALELIDTLVENCGSANRMMIHTSGLNEVHPFGKAVFQKRLPAAVKLNSSIIFMGEHAEEIATPFEGNACRPIFIQGLHQPAVL